MYNRPRFGLFNAYPPLTVDNCEPITVEKSYLIIFSNI